MSTPPTDPRSGGRWSVPTQRPGAATDPEPLTGPSTLGDALCAAMARDGRPVSEVAVMLGASRANLVGWCSDLLDPGPESFDVLTEYLGIDIDELGRLMIRSKVRRAARDTDTEHRSAPRRVAN